MSKTRGRSRNFRVGTRLTAALSIILLSLTISPTPANAAATSYINRDIYLGIQGQDRVYLPSGSTWETGRRILLDAGTYRWGHKFVGYNDAPGADEEVGRTITLARGYYLWVCWATPRGDNDADFNYYATCTLDPENPVYHTVRLPSESQSTWFLWGDYHWQSYLDPQF